MMRMCFNKYQQKSTSTDTLKHKNANNAVKLKGTNYPLSLLYMLSQNCYDQFLPLRVQGGPHLVGIVSKLDGRLEDCSNSTHGPQVRVFF